ncbi:MAG TPA: hemerythrin domain-containing protein [Anaeromyxobacteraceae bacterium]|nr:hemerythrin domain-containing protein [Anaeromyxobacteraceae bacterium]
MDAIETLMNEHRTIERGIDALISFVDEVSRAGTEDKAELGRFVTFIREFADGCHHGKEEDILFAAMVEAGFPRHGGPVAVMLMEHDHGRAFVKELGDLVAKPEGWNADDRELLVSAAHGYANLLRQHIHKEDAILYPMAEQRLPPETMERVAADCERYELEKAGSGERERLLGLVSELVARHAPLEREEGSRSVRGCCG